MTTRVFYDSDGLFIDGMEAQPPRSLVSMIVGNKVWVRNRADFTLLALDYGQYADKTGATFASPTAVKAYLDAEFAKYPAPTWGDITGKPATFPPSTHTHAGLLSLVGTATVGETTVLALALGVKRYNVAMPGLAVGDRVLAMLTGSPGSSSLQDVFVSAANTLNVGLLNPALGIGATIAVPIAVYKVT